MDLVSRRKLWLLISGIVVTVSIVSLIGGWLITGSPLNFGIDFTGGTLIELKIPSVVKESQVKEKLSELKYEIAIVQTIPTTNKEESQFLIRTPLMSPEKLVSLQEGLKKSFEGLEVMRSELVGATIGADLRRQAIFALSLALLCITLYITWRFYLPHAIVTLIALVHDVFIVLGAYALVRYEINTPFVAVILTLVGYSVMDSVVVLDKVRENMKIHSGALFPKVVNMSILQSFRRSINTSVTTILAVLAIFILGPDSVRPFAFGLGIGLITGTYSSLFIASMLLVVWNDWRESRMKKAVGRRGYEPKQSQTVKRKP